MSEFKTAASIVGTDNGDLDLRILRNDELDTVSGGFLAEALKSLGDGVVGGQIVSPRDAASGLPTGK